MGPIFTQAMSTLLFEMDDGDSLNLKSVLSDFLFSMMAANQTYILSGHVVCQVESDYQFLENYITETVT